LRLSLAATCLAGALSASAALAADPVVLAAGDIANCESDGDEETADLLAANPNAPILLLGDIAYPDGSADDFEECFDPSWGAHKARMYPSPGNHEYHTEGADGYFDYFGAVAGDPDEGWYSFDLGSWHIVSLNSNCDEIGGCSAGSPQGQWLAADLAANPSTCTLAFWHHPRFSSSSKHGSDDEYEDLWEILDAADADLVLVGHDHGYERFAPQDKDGNASASGIREFVVGTGGAERYDQGDPEPNSQVRDDSSWGVLKLTLKPAGYDWQFLAVPGDDLDDSGSASCVGAVVEPPPDECTPQEGGDVDGDGVCGNDDNCPSDANPNQADGDGDGWGDVCDPGAGGGIDLLVSAPDDDASESGKSGKVRVGGKSLKLGKGAAGFRFADAGIPAGADIQSAFVEFELEKPYAKPASLEIRGEESGAAGPFQEEPFGVSARAETSASVDWTIAAAPKGEKGLLVARTPDLAAVLQELVNGPGWTANSAVVLVFSGEGSLSVPAFEGDPPTASRLHVVLGP
jgi:hypothetical protein